MALAEHEKHCDGIDGKPTRIEMPTEDNNDFYFKNYQNQQKVPYVIYADFQSLIQKKEGPENQRKEDESFTENKNVHMACGYAYKVVRSNGTVMSTKYYRGENTAEEFLKEILNEEANLRNSLEDRAPIFMQQED